MRKRNDVSAEEMREAYDGRIALDASKRANKLADECGGMRSQLKDTLAENALLRREIEQLKRKAGKR